MHLLLMRHGEAEPYKISDEDRHLTSRGIDEAKLAAEWVREHVGEIDKALVSPYVRAQETYQAMMDVIQIKNKETYSDIVPNGNASLIHDYIDTLLCEETNIDSLIVVSHMPLVSYLMDNICQRHQSILFATSAIALIDYDPTRYIGSVAKIYCPD